MEHAWERTKMYTIFWLENLKERGNSGDVDEGGSIILRWILGK
jgi:hypothetical protein